MGSGQSSLSYRTAFVELANKTQPINAYNDEFWDQFWCGGPTRISDMFASVPGSEIRTLREESPGNLATLCYKAVERLAQLAETSFLTTQDQQIAINCVRLLTRIIPYIFEVPEWRPFFWSVLPAQPDPNPDTADSVPLAQTLVSSLCDLLFCPDFTVHSLTKSGPENAEDIHTIDSCEYIWEAGVGFAQSPPQNAQHDANRTEIIRLLLVCFSETMYLTQAEARSEINKWIAFFSGPENRHVLPLFTSLLNVVCAYNPASSSLPYNHLMFTDSREPLVEAALQMLCVILEADTSNLDGGKTLSDSTTSDGKGSNLFLNYMSRIHRDEDFSFVLDGITRLLNNPLTQTYLPGSAKKVHMHQELLILFWRICDINKKFMYYVLKSSRVLDVLVPILYYLNEARKDKSQLGLMHIGVFIILLLSGERNFGVRLNKPYSNRASFDITVFTGNHADLLIIVFHKIITTGHQCLQPLFDCLITIIDNVSPYVKSLSMVSASKLMHLTEAFSQPWFLFSSPNNFQLVLFLLEIFNNVIQYQFDGNSCLVYSIIRKRQVFYQLANLPTTDEEIREVLAKHSGLHRRFEAPPDTDEEDEVEDRTEENGEGEGEGNEDIFKKEAKEEGLDFVSTDVDQFSQAASLINDKMDEVKNEKGNGVASETKNGGAVVAQGDSEEMARQMSVLEGLQTSLTDTPSLTSMTDSQPVNAAHSSDYHLHSYEGEAPSTSSHIPAAASDSTTGSSTGEAVESRHLEWKSQDEASKGKVAKGTTKTMLERERAGGSDGNSRRRLTPLTVPWRPTARWVGSWHEKLPLQTIMRLLQVLVPQVEKICIEKSLKDEPEILKFLQNGTLVGLLPVPHPILIRKYQSNMGTTVWFRTYLWGVVYLRNSDPPIWFDTNVRLFEVQRT
ncbi:High temperature induced dauer formation protein [Echinococcus multilocularis]|uniref:High temperature induced dauer formation protein n=1 Tax=Echinococcus multilocularis TaxID=6211 RepID=A0A087VXA6_ECHMU|nr:High temperature induced dauer formation protein [Echinococcus multilocularis]